MNSAAKLLFALFLVLLFTSKAGAEDVHSGAPNAPSSCSAKEQKVLLQQNAPELRYEVEHLNAPPGFSADAWNVFFDGGNDLLLVQILPGQSQQIFTVNPEGVLQPSPRALPTLCESKECWFASTDFNGDGRKDILFKKKRGSEIAVLFAGDSGLVRNLGFSDAEPRALLDGNDEREPYLVLQIGALNRGYFVSANGEIRDDRDLNASSFLPTSQYLWSAQYEAPMAIKGWQNEEYSVVLGMPYPQLDSIWHRTGKLGRIWLLAQFEPRDLRWAENIFIHDINGDGLNDILSWADPSRNFWAAIQTKAGFFEAPIEGLPVAGKNLQIVAGVELNNDGAEDFLFFDRDTKSLLLARSRSVLSFVESASQGSEEIRERFLEIQGRRFPINTLGEVCIDPEVLRLGERVRVDRREMIVAARDISKVASAIDSTAQIDTAIKRSRALLRAPGSHGEKYSLDTVPVGPFLCNGYHIDEPLEGGGGSFLKWGKRLALCPEQTAFFASQEEDRTEVGRIGTYNSCCPLPFDDMLSGPDIETHESCPEGSVVVGSRQEDNKIPGLRSWICRRIADRYQLGEEMGGVYYGRGFSARAHSGRIRIDQIPAAIRSGVLRGNFSAWEVEGCIAQVPGAVLTGRSAQGRGCSRLRFRQIQYKGQEGDPPPGTPVKMFPECSSIDNPYRPDAKCMF